MVFGPTSLFHSRAKEPWLDLADSEVEEAVLCIRRWVKRIWLWKFWRMAAPKRIPRRADMLMSFGLRFEWEIGRAHV